jgi:hypothetical protein
MAMNISPSEYVAYSLIALGIIFFVLGLKAYIGGRAGSSSKK